MLGALARLGVQPKPIERFSGMIPKSTVNNIASCPFIFLGKHTILRVMAFQLRFRHSVALVLTTFLSIDGCKTHTMLEEERSGDTSKQLTPVEDFTIKGMHSSP